MAKKGSRVLIDIICTGCKSQNYTTQKNKTNDPKELVLNKFCKVCRKVVEHKEKK